MGDDLEAPVVEAQARPDLAEGPKELLNHGLHRCCELCFGQIPSAELFR